MTEHNSKPAVQQFVAHLFNKKIEEAATLLSPDFVYHAPGFPEVRGPEEYQTFYRQFFANSPHLEFTVHDMIAEESATAGMVACRLSWHTIHEREFMGMPPTGKPLSVRAFLLFRVVKGKITEYEVLDDYLGLMRQLGGVPISLLQTQMKVPGINVVREVPVTA